METNKKKKSRKIKEENSEVNGEEQATHKEEQKEYKINETREHNSEFIVGKKDPECDVLSNDGCFWREERYSLIEEIECFSSKKNLSPETLN